MEEEIEEKLAEIEDYLYAASCQIEYAQDEIKNIQYGLIGKAKNEIKSIENFKTKLRQEGLYTTELEEFMQNYLKFYNK